MISCYVEPKPVSNRRQEVAKMIKELELDADEALRLTRGIKEEEDEVVAMRHHLAKRTTYPQVASAKMLKIRKRLLNPSVTELAIAADAPAQERADKEKCVADLQKAIADADKSGVDVGIAMVGTELVDMREAVGPLTDAQKQVVADAMGRAMYIWEDEEYVLIGTDQKLVDTAMPRWTGALAIVIFLSLGLVVPGYCAAANAMALWLHITVMFSYAVLMIPFLVAVVLYAGIAFLYVMNRKDREVMARALAETAFTREVCLVRTIK